MTAFAVLGISGASALAQDHYTAIPLLPGQLPVIVSAPDSGGFDHSWHTIDGGGRLQRNGTLSLDGTVGQLDTGTMTATGLELTAGFWGGVFELEPCYGDCDESGSSPRLTANDFACFMNRYTAGQPYANCDGSATPPVLNILDFQCFINKFAAGCS